MKTLNIPTVITALAVATTFLISTSTRKGAVINDQAAALSVYERAADKLIGITPGKSALGLSYSVRTDNGSDIEGGIISSTSTFYIPTEELKAGIYTLLVGNIVLKEFYIK